jgi:hypothetical protein
MSATDLESAIELLIANSNILSEVINDDASSEITTPSGPIPSLRKALADNLYFKDPIPWVIGGTEANFNQLRTFTDGSVWWSPSALNTDPSAMGNTPYGDSKWTIAPIYLMANNFVTEEELGKRTWYEWGTNSEGNDKGLIGEVYKYGEGDKSIYVTPLQDKNVMESYPDWTKFRLVGSIRASKVIKSDGSDETETLNELLKMGGVVELDVDVN